MHRLLRGAKVALRLGMARKIHVIVRPGARKTDVTKIADGEFRVSVCARAVDGKANHALIELLAAYFNVAKSKVKIIRGPSSRHKIIEISE